MLKYLIQENQEIFLHEASLAGCVRMQVILREVSRIPDDGQSPKTQ
jgi:hypothetical protein